MKKSILNLGKALKKAEQEEVFGGYGGYSGGGGSSSPCCGYQLSGSGGTYYTNCYDAQRLVWMYGSPSGSYWQTGGTC